MTEEEKDQDEIEIVTDEEGGNLPDLQKKIKKLKEDWKKCEAERKEYLEGWQRSKADFINYRKEEDKRFEDMARFVTAELIQEILPMLDSFDLALRNHQLPTTNPQPIDEKGISLVFYQLLDILKKQGLEQIKVEVGDDFTPEKHESIGEIESDLAEGKIVEVIQKGYLFQNRVLRPARVKISK